LVGIVNKNKFGSPKGDSYIHGIEKKNKGYMKNEKELLSKLYVDLCNVEKQFSDIHNKQIDECDEGLSGPAVDLINDIFNDQLYKLGHILEETHGVDLYELLFPNGEEN
jgi:hypothetical protein